MQEPEPEQEPEQEPEPEPEQEPEYSAPEESSSPHAGSPRTPAQATSLLQSPSTDHSRRRSSGRITWNHGSGRRTQASPGDTTHAANLDRSTARCANTPTIC